MWVNTTLIIATVIVSTSLRAHVFVALFICRFVTLKECMFLWVARNLHR